MDIKILETRLYRKQVGQRLAGRFGIVRTRASQESTHVILQTFIEVDGKVFWGLGAETLALKWFTKDPDKPADAELQELLGVIEAAQHRAKDLAGTPFEVWQQLYIKQTAWGKQNNLPPLLYQFGSTLVERGMIEACCKATGRPFSEWIRTEGEGGPGINLGSVRRQLKGETVKKWLPEKPLTRIIARHTIVIDDVLKDEDVAPEDKKTDGLPQTLEGVIREYGIKHFKIKIVGEPQKDFKDLRAIALVVKAEKGEDFEFNLDANENYTSTGGLRELWEKLMADPVTKAFFRHLLFIEQPFKRDLALSEEVKKSFGEWDNRPPIVIDESDAELESFPRALELGYNGTSHKNCKGVFKGIINRCHINFLNETENAGLIMSGEDLGSIGPVAMLQDLTLQANLGNGTVERNGHHYYPGLSMFSEALQRRVLETHGDLYKKAPEGWPTINIVDGEVAIDSLLAAPLGTGFEMDLSEMEEAVPVAQT